MCGILAILGLDSRRVNYPELRSHALAMVKKVRHRGPDWDEAFQRNVDPSGRAVLGIHADAYKNP
jgi:asparagine synthetase B (glutamine-hydrolysing)